MSAPRMELSGYDHRRRVDGRRHWPDRNLGDLWEPGAMQAEVEAALTRHPISEHQGHVVAAAPAPKPMSLNAAARLVGISPAAMLKRSRRVGLAAAIAMGGRHDRAKRINLKRNEAVEPA